MVRPLRSPRPPLPACPQHLQDAQRAAADAGRAAARAVWLQRLLPKPDQPASPAKCFHGWARRGGGGCGWGGRGGGGAWSRPIGARFRRPRCPAVRARAAGMLPQTAAGSSESAGAWQWPAFLYRCATPCPGTADCRLADCRLPTAGTIPPSWYSAGAFPNVQLMTFQVNNLTGGCLAAARQVEQARAGRQSGEASTSVEH